MSPDPARTGGPAGVARGVSWVGAGHVAGQLAWYASLLFIAALVPPRSFGSVAVAMVVVQIAWLLVGSGTRGALVLSRRVSRPQVRRTAIINVATGMAAAVGLALLAAPIVRLVTPSADPLVLKALALAVALFGFSIVPLALLQRAMLFKRHAAVNAGAAVLASGVAIAAALAGLGVWALVVRQVLFQALLAAFGWAAVRGLVPPARPDDLPGRRDPVAWWFFALGVIAFLSLNVDYVLVGHFGDATQVGLYSLAFVMAFAPLTQFAWQIGKVLFASAARADAPADVGARAARSARLTALIVWPLVPPAFVLAPHILPRLLGPEWQPMVLPFQLLLIAGAAHAVLAIVREFLLGAGNVHACFVLDATWLMTTVLALLVLVPTLGVVGAALTHVALLVPLAGAYTTLAVRRLQIGRTAVWRAMRLVVVAVAGQAAMTALESWLVQWAGAPPALAAAGGALAGIVALVALLAVGETPPHKELTAVARSLRAGRASEAVAQLPAGPAVAVSRALPALPVPAVTVSRARPARPAPAAGLGARLAVASLGALAIPAGAIAVQQPRFALGLVVAGLAVLFAFRAPVAHLLGLIALTAIVPLDVQARFGSGGSVAAAGILPSDVLLLAGLARTLVVLPRQPLSRGASVAAGLTVIFLIAATLQLLHALALGRPISGVGGEFRALLGFGALVVALPILADAAARRRLLAGLAWLGLGLGLWGIVQFALHLRFMDVGVPIDPGSFQTAGRVVGLFAFPVAATLALAVLTGGEARSVGVRTLLAGVVITNLLAVVLTFERTFLLVTLIGFGLVFVRGTSGQRTRLALWTPVALVLTGLVFALLAPAALSAYGDRLLSVTSVKTDPAVHYRVVESRLVAHEVLSRPIVGSALGATILIGRPGTNVAPAPRRHAENGYLWLAWKVGIPAALAMCALLALAMAAPRRRWEEPAGAVLRRGCQAALAAVAIASFSFPSFNQTGITALMGVLAAACVAAELAAAPRRRTVVYA